MCDGNGMELWSGVNRKSEWINEKKSDLSGKSKSIKNRNFLNYFFPTKSLFFPVKIAKYSTLIKRFDRINVAISVLIS